MSASVFIATSLDGFIARLDGGLDWLPPIGEAGSPDGDYGYGDFMATVDALVMGRRTYDVALSFGSWFYGEMRVVVLTNRAAEPPPGHASTVEFMSGDPRDIATCLEDDGAEHLYVDGGTTIQAWLSAGLVHRLIITRIPVLLGDGIPLFGPLAEDVPLTHVETRAFSNGLVQSEYTVGSVE